MKSIQKIIAILSISIAGTASSQVIINADAATAKTTLTSATSVLLEFGSDGDKGIILPYVETVPTGANNSKGGTLIFDVSANGEYKVKVKNENSGWTDLSVESGYSTTVANVVKAPQPAALTDNASAKAIIGSPTSSTEGVLVLESATKAMILPTVSNFTDIKNPSPGMMAFLKHTSDNTKHRLIVFNGQKWAFWEAN